MRHFTEEVLAHDLDFVSSLKSRQTAGKSAQQDMSAFDRFGAVYDGHFNRDELYDRKVFR